MGYDAIEVFGKHVEGKTDEQLADIRRRADDAGIELLVVSPYFVLTRGREEYDQTMETGRFAVHAARILGASKIRTFTDVAATGIGSDIAEPHHWEQAVEGLTELTGLDRSLEFVVEMHAHTLADTADSALTLLERVGAPNLKLLFQPGKAFLDQGLHDVFDRLQPHIRHMHLQQIGRDHGEAWVEEAGELDFAAFIEHLHQAGYDGSMSIEYCWKGVPRERARTAAEFMRRRLGAARPARQSSA
jgi:3-dehydroshikimate dehydratase